VSYVYVNGMSFSLRQSKWANFALVAQVCRVSECPWYSIAWCRTYVLTPCTTAQLNWAYSTVVAQVYVGCQEVIFCVFHDITCIFSHLTLQLAQVDLNHSAPHCNTQHTATHCNTLQHTTTRRNTLQHTATHCNILQHPATHT